MGSRIQRKRTAGWTAPVDAEGRTPVYVGRGSRWGNPYPVVLQADGLYGVPPQEHGDQWPTFSTATDARTEAVRLYEVWLEDRPWLANVARRDLAGRNLMCWCPDGEPCHADVLLELANASIAAGEA